MAHSRLAVIAPQPCVRTTTEHASGIADFDKILKHVTANSTLRRNITIDNVGNVEAFLLSDLASGITSEINYVDGGIKTVPWRMIAS